MSKSEYLTKRGWVAVNRFLPERGHFIAWTCPLSFNDHDEERAVAVQHARDAAEERAAWVRFAAAQTWASAKAGTFELPAPAEIAAMIGRAADLLLAEFRSRFPAPDGDGEEG